MFFCNFSKAFTSTCRTRSRLMPNSEPSSSSVAAFSDKRRFWMIYCSLGFNVFIAEKEACFFYLILLYLRKPVLGPETHPPANLATRLPSPPIEAR